MVFVVEIGKKNFFVKKKFSKVNKYRKMFLVPSSLHQRLEKSSKVALTHTIEEHTFKFVNNCLNTSIYSYLEISGGQSSNLFLNVVKFFNTSVNLTSVAA
jgi:hypothetical protein